MHTLLARWLFPAIAVGVALFLIIFLFQVNQTDASIYENQTDIPHADQIAKIPSKDKWIERFSKQDKEGYFYPVTEISIEIDLKDPPKKTTIYQLKAGDLDPYQLFCLKEVLKQYKVKYMFEQKKDEMKLVIYSKNVSQLKNIVKTLKNYAINATIVKLIR